MLTPKQIAIEIAEYTYFKLKDKTASKTAFLHTAETFIILLRRIVDKYKLSNHDIYEYIHYPTNLSTITIRKCINQAFRKFSKEVRANVEIAFYHVFGTYKPDEELVLCLSNTL